MWVRIDSRRLSAFVFIIKGILSKITYQSWSNRLLCIALINFSKSFYQWKSTISIVHRISWCATSDECAFAYMHNSMRSMLDMHGSSDRKKERRTNGDAENASFKFAWLYTLSDWCKGGGQRRWWGEQRYEGKSAETCLSSAMAVSECAKLPLHAQLYVRVCKQNDCIAHGRIRGYSRLMN